MYLNKDYILVTELKDDIFIDGLLTKYDDTNPYIFAKIIDCSEEAFDNLFELTLAYTDCNYNITRKLEDNFKKDIKDYVLVLKRVAKIPYLNNYIVSFEDIISMMTLEEYTKLLKGE